MKPVPLLVYFLFAHSVVRATAIAVIWTPNGAIFGADAKLLTDDGKDAGTGCKIGQVADDILFAESGILGVPAARIEVRPIIREALSVSGDVDQGIARVESSIVPILTGILNAPRIRPGVLKDIRAGRQIQGLQVIIVTYKDDHGRAFLRNFVPKRNGTTRIKIEIERTNCPEDPACKNTAVFAAKSHPNSVGPPFAIAFITKDQIVWPRPGVCDGH
jgi:hypothetical protein